MGLTRGRAYVTLAAVILAALLAGCVRGKGADVRAPEPAAPAKLAPGQFLDVRGNPVEPAWVASQAASAAYVLLGESHTSPCDHLAQARVLELMVRAGVSPVVGLEMVSLDRQFALDRFNAGVIGVDELESALDWPNTWGYPFAAYRPVFETARRLGLPLFALNAPRDVVRKAGKVGLKGLTQQERQGLPAAIVPVPKGQEQWLRQVFDAHPGGAPKNAAAAWKSFLTVQALWDTTMARRAVQARVEHRRPVAILAGTGHVEFGWGIASRLSQFDPKGQRLLVMPLRQDPAVDPMPDATSADLFFYCPIASRPRLGLVLTTEGGALTVQAVDPDSRAHKAGFLPGDVIRAAQGEPVTAVGDLHTAGVRAVEQGEPLRLDILRQGEPLTLTVPLPARNP